MAIQSEEIPKKTTPSERATKQQIFRAASTSNTIILSSHEQETVKDLIASLERETDYATPISDSDKAISPNKERTLAALRTAISPHKRIPVEIWTNIFTQTLDVRDGMESEVFYLKISVDPKDNPFYLQHVCSTWRRIVRWHKPLRNSIVLDETDDNQRNIFPKDGFRDWNRRVRLAARIIPSDGPLYLSISQTMPSYMDYALIRLIEQNRRRVRMLDLRGRPKPMSRVMHYLNDFPALETLTLDFTSGHLAGPSMMEYPEIQYLRKIRKLSLSNVTGGPFFHLTFVKYFQWDLITHLELDSNSEEPLHAVQVLQTLQRCKNLVSCSVVFLRYKGPFWIDGKSISDATSNPPSHIDGKLTHQHRGDFEFQITLPHLRSLKVQAFVNDPFTSLTVPALEELDIIWYGWIPDDDIHSMIKRSACRLIKYRDTLGDIATIDPSNAGDTLKPELLESLDCVQDFSSHTPLSRTQLDAIADGALLPRTTTFKAMTAMCMPPVDFVRILGRRSIAQPSIRPFQSITCIFDARYIGPSGEQFADWVREFESFSTRPVCTWHIESFGDTPEVDTNSDDGSEDTICHCFDCNRDLEDWH